MENIPDFAKKAIHAGGHEQSNLRYRDDKALLVRRWYSIA